MSCVVGVQHDGVVVIGGDSISISGSEMTVRADTKVFTRDGMVFGFTGSWRYGQLIRYAPEFPPPPRKVRDLDAYMVRELVPAMRAACEDAGLTGEMDCSFLVGVNDVLFHIGCDFAICRARDNYMAIGVASDVALGSLHTTHRDRSWMHPADRCRIALLAAEHHSIGVTRPFLLLCA